MLAAFYASDRFGRDAVGGRMVTVPVLYLFQDFPDGRNEPDLEDRSALGIEDSPVTVLLPPFVLH